MPSKILILPYFGNFPPFFDFFIESMKSNVNIDLLIFSDQDISVSSNNIKVIKMTFGEIRDIIKAKFSDDICLESPYKLCDYRPAYGYIFNDHIKGYDYWGHCDCDLIFGNLSLLEPYFDKGYERIGEYGHLIFYRNNEKVNNYFRTLRAPNVPSWEEVTHNTKGYSFDEHGGMGILCEVNNIYRINDRLFDDIIFYRKKFFSRRKFKDRDSNPRIPIYFEYYNGHLIRHYKVDNKWSSDESLYVHFQKRNILVEASNHKHYLIVPNRIVSETTCTKQIEKICTCSKFDFKFIWTMIKYNVKKILYRL